MTLFTDHCYVSDESESLLVAKIGTDEEFPLDEELVMEDDADEITPDEAVIVEGEVEKVNDTDDQMETEDTEDQDEELSVE